MDRWGTRNAADSHALEGIAVALTAWLAASAIRADLDLLWQTMAILFRL
ncbi:MAG: hypothetical protein ACT4UP_08620 [Gammaproteobacteria bacterium]